MNVWNELFQTMIVNSSLFVIVWELCESEQNGFL